MGDAGSTTVGFLLAVVPFEAGSELRPQLVFSIFLFLWFFLSDGMFTLGRRLLRGDAIWKAHRSHLYQQLAAAGIAHDIIVLRVIGMAAVVTLVTVTSAKLENAMVSWVSLSVALVLFVIYVSWSERIARE
jgi:Fuc2NAc and GlcNAc transferase